MAHAVLVRGHKTSRSLNMWISPFVGGYACSSDSDWTSYPTCLRKRRAIGLRGSNSAAPVSTDPPYLFLGFSARSFMPSASDVELSHAPAVMGSV